MKVGGDGTFRIQYASLHTTCVHSHWSSFSCAFEILWEFYSRSDTSSHVYSFCSLPGVLLILTSLITSSNCHGTIKHDLDWIGTSNFSKHVWAFWPMVSLRHIPQSYQIISSIVWITMTVMNIFNWHSIDWKGKCLEMFGDVLKKQRERS